jgi:twitching motility protein PilT
MPSKLPAVSPDELRAYITGVLTPFQWQRFQDELELDFAYNLPGTGRFRVNVFQQRGSLSMVFRLVPERIPGIDELGFPPVLKEIAMRPRGLVVITGPAGCGKSATQAAMIDYRNSHDPCHIMTVEDPVEFVHPDKKAIVNQRELGRDTLTFADALKYVLRQDPDVILIGEMRDLETIQLAITAAETGHLVLATLHTTDAVQTIDRIIDVFPTHQQDQIRMQVAVNFVAVVSQILVKRADNRGRMAAFEVMVGTGAVRNLIREAKTYQLQSLIQTSIKQGMSTLNMSLAGLFKRNVITLDEAFSRTADPDNLQQLLKTM